MQALQGWDNFFAMAGTAAATLTGLLFVVITLGTELSRSGISKGVHAFLTPTLVHFSGVVLQALIMLVPWPTAAACGIAVGVAALGGLVYAALVARRIAGLRFVSLELQDWATYSGIPAAANLGLLAGAIGLAAGWRAAPFAVAAGVAALLFVGIFDAWDLTLWIVRARQRTDGG